MTTHDMFDLIVTNTQSLYFEFTVSQIDNKYMKISEFKDDTLFSNIYHYWCFVHFLSPYYFWENNAIETLRRNIIQKWPKKDLSNVYLFLELLSCKAKEVDPCDYFFQTEDYFTLLMSLKDVMDQMISDRHLIESKPKYVTVKRKCIR